MEENKTTIVQKTVKSGITFGSALAMVISYTKAVGKWNVICWHRNAHGMTSCWIV